MGINICEGPHAASYKYALIQGILDRLEEIVQLRIFYALPRFNPDHSGWSGGW